MNFRPKDPMSKFLYAAGMAFASLWTVVHVFLVPFSLMLKRMQVDSLSLSSVWLRYPATALIE